MLAISAPRSASAKRTPILGVCCTLLILAGGTQLGCSVATLDLEGLPCDADNRCAPSYSCDTVTNICEPEDELCIDADDDGFGEGPGCLGPDCNDNLALCADDCESDADSDGVADCSDPCVDIDGDGYGNGLGCSGLDCDDTLVTGAECNLGCAPYFLDMDADGVGDSAQMVTACGPPTGFVAVENDCDDSRPDCAADCSDMDQDGACADNDCDDSAGTGSTCTALCTAFFEDRDSDGFGDATSVRLACTQPPGFVPDNTDCDDSAATGSGCASTCIDYYRDFDEDGSGDAASVQSACAQPSGFVANSTDCDDARPECATSCADNDGDTVCEDADCDDSAATGASCQTSCQTFYEDVDGDGLGNPAEIRIACASPEGFVVASTDCDDRLSTCLSDCSDADTDGAADCLEVFCGSEPGGATCTVVSSGAEFDAAIGAANPFVLVGDIVADAAFSDLNVEDASYRQIPGTKIVVTDTNANPIIKVVASGVLIDSLHIEGNPKAAIELAEAADSCTVTRTIVDGFSERGIYVNGGDDPILLDNVVVGGGGPVANDKAAIVIKNSSGALVVGNVVAQNTLDGVQINAAALLTFDHNTVADNGADGVRFRGADSSDSCFRNNGITGNVGAAISFERAAGWNETSCLAPLDVDGSGNSVFGNNAFNNGGLCAGDCTGTTEAACAACLGPVPPRGQFWEFMVDPLYVSNPPELGQPEFYCPGSPQLIDTADDLMHDRNGDAPGLFSGAAPDIGGRETGSLACQ